MKHWRDRASELLGADVADARRLAGGDLSAVFHITLTDGRGVVAKLSQDAPIEADMLRALGAADVPVPYVLTAEPGLLLMEALRSGGRLSAARDSLAEILRTAPAFPNENYGWSADYAFGSVAIVNTRVDDWPTFWAENRLLCHAPHVATELARRLEKLASQLSNVLPQRPAPELLHGDLWGGNVLVDGDMISGLIDPASYFGHREVDVAMLTLFDHPPQYFFDLLDLEPGWRERLPAYRLWPLLVHLRLFGDSYRGNVEAALADLGC